MTSPIGAAADAELDAVIALLSPGRAASVADAPVLAVPPRPRRRHVSRVVLLVCLALGCALTCAALRPGHGAARTHATPPAGR